jgi:hypothetical protein
MHAKPHWINSSHQAVSNGSWHATWFLTVDKLFPLKYESPKASEEALNIRTRSYKLAPKLIKQESCCKQEVIGQLKDQVNNLLGRV